MAKFTEIITVFLLVALYLFTAWAKFTEPQIFVDALKAYQLFPESLIPIIVYYIPFLEVLLAVGLMLPKYRHEALCSSLILMTIFELLLLSFLVRGLDGDCGCFGKFGGSPLSAFVKNIFIICLILFTLYVTRNKTEDNSPFAENDQPIIPS